VLVPLVLAAVAAGGTVWNVGIAVLAAIGGREFDRMATRGGFKPAPGLAAAGSAATVLSTGYLGLRGVGPVLATITVLAFLDQIRRADERRSLADWAVGIAAPTYVGLMLGFLAKIRHLPDGAHWTLLLLLIVWANDSGAYAGGRAFGRRLLAPVLSPKKTWEGLVAGLLASVLTAGTYWYAYQRIDPPPVFYSDPPPATSAAMGLLAYAALAIAVSVAGPLGDLSKSFVKRQVGVKDAGSLIPGHGGVLDRMDSLMFAAPVTYAWIALLHWSVR
jgi:phosphatidate cytidylyltransferase